MSIIRVTKEFRFEMAHALWGYDGPCSNIHGHSYILYVTFAGEPLNEPANAHNGMVIDFSDLKEMVRSNITDRFDHSLLISGIAPAEEVVKYRHHFGNVIIVPFQPTCENLVSEIASILAPLAPQGTFLHSVRLHETATAYAEWHASDNN